MASTKTTERGPKAPPMCEKCGKNPVAFSDRTKRYIKLCSSCNAVKREANNQSYHNRHQRKEAEERMQEQLSKRAEQLHQAKRECATINEQLATLNLRYKAMEAAFEASQRSLADALETVNKGGAKDGVQLPSAVSVRSESVVVQRLQELTELVTSWNSANHAEVHLEISKLREEREEAKAQHAELVSEMERLVSKLAVRAAARHQE